MDDTKVQKLDTLDEQTIKKIDFIIRGLELGKYDDAAKKVEFLGKLSGEAAPTYIAKLLERIHQLEVQVQDLDLNQQTDKTKIIGLENQVNTLNSEMSTIASAIRHLFEPKPLSKNWDLSDIDQFCSRHGAGQH